MKKTLLIFLAILLSAGVALAFWWRGQIPASESAATSPIALRIHGSNTVGESLMPALVTAFLEQQGYALIRTEIGASPVEKTIHARVHPSKPDLRIEIHAHGSTTAFEDLAAGSADLGMSSRRIKTEEVEKLKARLGDLTDPKQEHVIALDALAIIVPPNHALEKLSIEQIAKIFAGDIQDWAELGLAAGPISLYSRDDKSGTYDTFKELVLKKFDKKLRGDARRFESSEALTEAVLADPNGIGFVGVAYAARAKLIAVSADGVKAYTRPAKHNIGTEAYALSRRLYVYEPANHGHALLTDFLRFAGSDAGQRLVDASGLISYYPTRDKPRVALQPFPARYQSLGTLGERLSVNFVSENAQLVLDSKTERDLARVANFFRDHPDKR
ncbi:MAG TPA: PstS family phosphate ABC transporter substrate-binding protein, partial [Permianibacter sp.]|nr:PstS family phosphate ABC transporter substrate-binding protein [Permianibacter sp.]